jgi:hypothetical protein
MKDTTGMVIVNDREKLRHIDAPSHILIDYVYLSFKAWIVTPELSILVRNTGSWAVSQSIAINWFLKPVLKISERLYLPVYITKRCNELIEKVREDE